uniref:Phosphotransferase n=1 Tax=Opuntia streptacantha TaxID=393608 RepID=A0A7C9DQE5_OPUST
MFISKVESGTKAREIVVQICGTIVKRGDRLEGAGIVGILQTMEEDAKGLIFGKRTVVTVGGVYETYPQYRRDLQDAVTELLGPELSHNVVIELSKDGSGIGATLLAAADS